MEDVKLKKCYRCYKDKDPKDFYVRNNKVLGVCSSCFEIHYAALCKPGTAQSRKINVNRKFVYEHLKNNPCIDCDESDILVLDFDHRVPELKGNGISNLLFTNITRLKNEISKCDVVCANCHRKRTAKMFGSWRLTAHEL